MTIKVSKTNTVRVYKNNQPHDIDIDNLPDNMINQIRIYDQIREDIVNLEYKLEIYKKALKSKQAEINKILSGEEET